MSRQVVNVNSPREISNTKINQTSLIGRGLVAFKQKEKLLSPEELNEIYQHIRDTYNRITVYGSEHRFDPKFIPESDQLTKDSELLQLQPFYELIQQLGDIASAFQKLADMNYGKSYFYLARIYLGGQGIKENIERADYYSHLAFDWYYTNRALFDSEIWCLLGAMYFDGQGVVQNYEQAYYWFKKSAEQNNIDAQFRLSSMYSSGFGTEKNLDQCNALKRQTAEGGHMKAQYYMGNKYNWNKDYEQALLWYRKSAEQGYAVSWFPGRYKGTESSDLLVFEWIWLQKSAALGSRFAQLRLGQSYLKGRGIDQDNNKALFWIKRAIEQNSSRAKWVLGEMYHSGQGVKQDLVLANTWYENAAEDSELFQYDLGNLFYFGSTNISSSQYPWEQNYEKAVFWFRKSFQSAIDKYDDPELVKEETFASSSAYYLGEMYYHGDGLERDFNHSALWFRRAADLEERGARRYLGYMYRNGLGVEQDHDQAAFWFRKAADQGDERAQYYLGVHYANGQGVEKDIRQAVYWWTQSAEKGYSKAQYYLGLMLIDGKGVEKNTEKALFWWKKAADNGHSKAQCRLGFVYSYGQIIETDDAQAVYWLKMAVENNHPAAMFRLGFMYANGRGVEQNDEQAVKLCRMAAEMNDVSAQWHLGDIYWNGRRLEQDKNQATFWLRKAAQKGHPKAQETLTKFGIEWIETE